MKRFAKDFGETSSQAVVRWSVQTCRELAVETQAWGKQAKKTKDAQRGAMIADAYNVLLVAERAIPRNKSYQCINTKGIFYASKSKFLESASEVNNWIELNSTRRSARTAKLHPKDRKVCTRKTFDKAMRARLKRAGIAKGGWLGAGQDIAKAQTGQGKINIGKNFLGYAQKHSAFGDSKKPRDGFTPAAFVTNKASHISKDYVLKRSAYDKALKFGMKATLRWYAKAVRSLDKKKP